MSKRSVMVGDVKIGGGAPIPIQSMTNTKTTDITATLAQIESLAESGCDIVRLAVPDMEAAKTFGKIKTRTNTPLVADIHFDHRLALECIDGGADKIRINPGNIGGEDNVREVAKAARKAGIPIRVGVNGGSIADNSPKGMVAAALENVELLNKHDFDDIVISLKNSNVSKTIAAYRLISQQTPHPLHIGVTEAGTLLSATVKSAVGIGSLLLDGIGDTLRVSITGNPLSEVEVAREILVAVGLSREGVEVISCPTCGRTQVDLVRIAEEVKEKTRSIKKKMTIAVMGCAVNGPGEAKEADLGVACGLGKAVLFKKGEIVRTIGENSIVEELLKELPHNS